MGRTLSPTQAQLEVISPAGEISFLPLPPGTVIRLGQAPQNNLVLDSPGIAPCHLILDHRHTACRLLLLSQGEATRLNGQILKSHTASELHHLDLIEVGGYSLILLADSDLAGHFVNEPQIEYFSGSAEAARLIEVSLSDRLMWVGVGQTITCQASLNNTTTAPLTALISVEGVDESWLTIAPAQVELGPGQQTQISLTVTPSIGPTGTAGSHALTVIVTSPAAPGWCNRQEASLNIKPYYDFTLAELTPRQQNLSYWQQTGQTVVTLTNKGNTPTLFQLTAASTGSPCHFEFQLPSETASLATAAELRVLPGQVAAIPMRVTPPTSPLIKPGRCVYPYILTATLLDGPQTTRSVLGQVSSAPLIGPWLMALMAFCLLGLAGFGVQMLMKQTWSRYISLNLVTPTPTPVPFQPLATATPTPLPVVTPMLTYEEIFQKVAWQYGLDSRLLAELAYRESRMNAMAVGSHNDMGLMQIIPSTWNEWAPKVGVSDPFDPYSNVLVAGAYLDYLRSYCRARGYYDTQWMLVGYNWGPDNLGKLFESQGGWEQVPEKQRNYALNIVNGIGIYRAELTQKSVDSSLKN